MTLSNNQKWIVSIVDKSFSLKTNQPSQLISLPDPATNENRQYILVNSNVIVEIQSFSEDFASFFVGRHIVKDGNLYVMNRVDPLFFVLADQVPDESKKYSWQPYDQFIGCVPKEVQDSIVENQMSHLCETMCNDQTDNMTYLKFSISKCLSWLQKKQECVYQVLLRQDQARQQTKKEKFASMAAIKGGSVSSSFNMPDDPIAAAPTERVIISDTKQLRIESIQVVCSYLSDTWTKMFINSLNDVSEDVVFETSTSKSKPVNRSVPRVEIEEAPKPIKKEIMQPKTMGNKRLAKVSTKGMKSLGSFFSMPATKKSKIQ